MKKLLYLHQYFQTNKDKGGTRSYEFARYLAKKNFKVNIITGTEQKIKNPYKNITIFSTNTKYDNKMSKIRRIISFISYNVKAILKGVFCKNIDVIFATSTPLTIGLPAVLLSKIKRKKLLFEVRDVWPDIPIELGYIRNKYTIRILKKFEMWIYNNSTHIIVLSTGMRNNLIDKGVSEDKISVIENFSNLYLYDEPMEIHDDFMKDKFVCIHPGTMGHVNGLDFILDVAKKLSDLDDITFLLIGEGKRKSHLKNRVNNEDIFNVIIKDALPKHEVVRYIKQSDLGIMCVDNRYKILEDNSANKFFDFLAAGLPILINYEGWQKNLIEEEKSGKSSLTPDSMAETILKLKGNPILLKSMSKNSRNLAEQHYSDVIAKKKLLKVINRL